MLLFLLFCTAFTQASEKLNIDHLLERAVNNSLQLKIQTLKVEETKSLGSSQTAWNNPLVTVESQKGDDNTASPIHKYQVALIQPITSPWKTHFKSKIAKSMNDIENHHYEDQKLMTMLSTLELIFKYNISLEKTKRVDNHVKRIEILQGYLRSRKFVSPQKQSEAFIVENKIRVLRKQLEDLNVQTRSLWLQLNVLLQLNEPQQLQTFWVNQALEIPKNDYLQKMLSFNHDLELSQFEIEKSQSEFSYEKKSTPSRSCAHRWIEQGAAGQPRGQLHHRRSNQCPSF